MSNDSISSFQELELLASPSSQELAQEITESQVANQKLLDFSQQPTNLILPELDSDIMESPSTDKGWSMEQSVIIEENLNFYKRCFDVVNLMKTQGPDPKKKIPKLPAKPQRSLNEVYQPKTKNQKQTRSQQELHDYLISKMIDIKMKIRREVFFFKREEIVSWEFAQKKITEGYRQIKRQNATSMFFNIQYGMLLETAFLAFKAEQTEGRRPRSLSWEEALLSLIDISLSYSKKLREIARLLWPYANRFSRVGISFTELYSMKADLKQMFESSEEIKNYWSDQTERAIEGDCDLTASQQT